ncbi:hypothetical protein ACFVGN_34545 [Streptomyces sp. NPDC057757]|uniref:hypothetical protein n=1 Tax=Streptomyces sp. NPDC057757 TaxID=3346241 RepID=UPI0036C1B04C
MSAAPAAATSSAAGTSAASAAASAGIRGDRPAASSSASAPGTGGTASATTASATGSVHIDNDVRGTSGCPPLVLTRRQELRLLHPVRPCWRVQPERHQRTRQRHSNRCGTKSSVPGAGRRGGTGRHR